MATAYNNDGVTVVLTNEDDKMTLVNKALDLIEDYLYTPTQWDDVPTREPMSTPHKPTFFRTH